MSARINKKRLGGALAVLLLLFLIVGGVAEVVKGPPDAGADDNPPPAPQECASQVHFFAVDTPNNFFGPASDGDVTKQKAELKYRRCLDPSLVVAHAHTWGIPGFAELNGDEQFAQKTRDLINDREAWRFVVSVMEELEAASQASFESMSGPYQTLYMLDGLTDVPLIRKAAPDRPSFEVIRFVHPDGRVVNLKLDCGFQPVAQDFPGIPPVEAAPPSGQPAPPSTPQGPPPSVPESKCPPPPGVPPRFWDYEKCEKKNSDFDYQQNQSPARQDPQDNTTSGVNTGPTPGAPPAPFVPPQGPTPQPNTPAPPPIPGGYDSGSPSGSGTPGGSTTNPDGTTEGGGATPAPSGPPVTVDTGTHDGDGGGF